MKQIILDLSKTEQQIEITENTELLGLFIGKDQDELVTLLDVVHKQPSLQSLTLIKAVLYDQSKLDMEGKLLIETGAKFTDSYLRIDVLLMSNDASARAIPSLEISEDDVKGGHGATIGKVDEQQLFYLQSRGLGRQQAEQILVEGFVSELIDRITDKEIQSRYQKQFKVH